MGRKQKIAIAVIGLVVLIAARFYSLRDISSEAIRLHLHLLGSSIYEYHEKTGRWPVRAEDLAQTLLPTQSPFSAGFGFKSSCQTMTFVPLLSVTFQ
jgi:hypothetical protein